MPKWQPGESQEFMFNRKSSSLFARNNELKLIKERKTMHACGAAN